MRKLFLPALLAATLSSCVIGANPVPPPHVAGSYRDSPPPERHFSPDAPSPWPPGAPPVPEGEPWNHDKLEHRYNAGTDACFDASKKAFLALKFTLLREDRKSGEMSAQMASLWARCTVIRRNDLTYVTFYFRVHGEHADEGMPGDFAQRCHVIVAELVGEQGRPTEK